MSHRDYQNGDLVKHVPSGEQFTVVGYFPGDRYRPPHVALTRVSVDEKRVHVVDLYAAPKDVRLIARVGERTMFPGDGWSDELLNA